MSENELAADTKKVFAIPPTIDARSVAVFGGGLCVGFILAVILSAMNSERYRLSTYDEVMASSAIQKAQEV